MGYQEFVNELRDLGLVVTEFPDGRVSFPYRVESGPFAGREVHIGFVVPQDFPVNPPGGPHISPRLLPITGGGGAHPAGGVLVSDFGPDWEYWSRPLSHWATTKRTVKDVIAHVRHLFDSQ